MEESADSLLDARLMRNPRARLLSVVLDGFAKPSSLRELHARGAVAGNRLHEAEGMIRSLVEASMLVAPPQPLAALFRSTLADDPATGLGAKTVAVIGAGLLGRLLIDDLVGAGVGAIRVCDPRRDNDDQLLVDGLSDDLWRAGANVVADIQTESDSPLQPRLLDELLVSCDAAVVAWESPWPALFHAVNRSALRNVVGWTLAFVDGDEVVVGPTTVPGKTACYLEYEMQNEVALVRNAVAEPCPTLGLEANFALPPFAKVAAGLASTCVLRHLTTGRCPTVNRVLRVDVERLVATSRDVLRLLHCPACELSPARYRAPSL